MRLVITRKFCEMAEVAVIRLDFEEHAFRPIVWTGRTIRGEGVNWTKTCQNVFICVTKFRDSCDSAPLQFRQEFIGDYRRCRGVLDNSLQQAVCSDIEL